MLKQNKIKRSDLADQLREHQIRSKLDWTSLSFFSYNAKLSSSSSSSSSSRMDMMIFVIWELVILAFVVSSVVSIYFTHLRLALILATIAWLLMLCMKVSKQVKLNRKTNRRMMLPLSM
ncbi:uncharacterized protein LOC143597730 [Bidens hawaiensis]|uniref:uncharacterized protein LOC143597730 n=1 Tax=Bidens hawaiensis TaxID=980011 RepID=UPI00404916EA